MFRSYQVQLKLTAAQRRELVSLLALSCELYNAALQERRDAWRLEHKNVTYLDQQKELTELRQLDSEYAAISADIMREPLRRVDLAFKGFFRRVKVGKRRGFPRFRSQDRYRSLAFGGCNPISIKASHLRIPSFGLVRFKTSRPLIGNPKIVTILRKAEKKWIARIVCDIGSAPQKPAKIDNPIGIDVGIISLATLSDGSVIDNPRWTKQYEDRIAKANQVLSRKSRHSKNRHRARQVLRKAHEQARNARDNYLHHVSKRLIQSHDLIAYEKLQISNMVRSNLAKHIIDAAWGKLIWQISYKAESAGRYAVAVDPRGTSQRCSGCNKTVKKLLADREHSCPKCGLVLGRDHNAARNILRLGESLVGIVPSRRAEVTA